MKLARPSTSEQWRKAGIVNIVLVSVCLTVLSACFAFSVTRPGSSLNVFTIISNDECEKTAKINLFLHLIINLISSGVLASSNFYMQVVCSPSRKEVDKAHAYLQSLDIGIPSVKNVRFVSKFKQICW